MTGKLLSQWFIESNGIECRLWPHLYCSTEIRETNVRLRDTRRTTRLEKKRSRHVVSSSQLATASSSNEVFNLWWWTACATTPTRSHVTEATFFVKDTFSNRCVRHQFILISSHLWWSCSPLCDETYSRLLSLVGIRKLFSSIDLPQCTRRQYLSRTQCRQE